MTTLRRPGLACVAVVATALIGCVSTKPMTGTYAGPAARPASLESRFSYAALDGVPGDWTTEEKRRYTLHRISLGAGRENGDTPDPVEIEYYAVPGPGPRPVALVLPILAGKNRVARQFAGYFAKNGLPAIIVYTRQKDSLLADLDDPEAAIRRSVARHRQVLDWIGTRDEFDPTRIGVFGASLGGFNALFLAAADARVRAVVPALAGADLPRVLVASEERRVAKNVDRFQAEREWSEEQMEAYLRSRIESDPLELARYIDARDALMIIARHDDAIPFISQLQLRQALGEPETVFLQSGHVTSLIYLPYLKWKVLDFFKTHLALE
jgi:fermentation-respiration switch protein FrsA (DUF1100 family)